MKKKNKLTINTLAMGNLKQRRKQYTILIIGIVLAMVFSSGITFFLSCWWSSWEENADRLYGKQDEIYLNATDIDFENGELSEYVSKYGYAHTIGYAVKDEENTDVGTAVSWLDENAVDMYYPYLYEGRLPESIGEIAVERQVLIQLGYEKANVGDKLTLTMKIPDGKGFSEKTEKRTYTLTGIMCNKRAAIFEWRSAETEIYMPSAFVAKGEQVTVGGKELLVAFVNIKLYEDEYISQMNTYADELWQRYYDLSEGYITVNTYFMDQDSFDGTSGTDIWGTMMYSIAFGLMLTLVSCLTIVNSFSNNLRERKKQIGMLRAVGATKRQIISIYAREAFLISLISAPISILVSYFGVKIIIKMLGEDLIFIPKVWILFVGALLGVIVVMCAALIPLISVSKSSPMQAIRNVEYMRKLRKKKIHSQKSFNVSSLLAKRNIMLSRSRQLVVSVLLALTVIGSCFSFSGLSHESSELGTADYEYWLRDSAGYDEYLATCTLDSRGYSNNDIAELWSSGYFSEIYATKKCSANILTDKFSDYEELMLISDRIGYSIYEEVDKGLTNENVREKATAKLTQGYMEEIEKYGYNSLALPVTFISMGEEYFEKIKESVIEGEINMDKINSGEEIILVAPQKIGVYVQNEFDDYTFIRSDFIDDSKPSNNKTEYAEVQERTYKVGDEIDLSIVCSSNKDKNKFVRNDRKVKIGAILNDDPPNLRGFTYIESIGVITTNEASSIFAPEVDYKEIYLKVKGEPNDELDSVVAPFVENMSFSIPEGYFENNYQFHRDDAKDMKILFFGLYCLVGIFLAICGSVINNALTARIREGKKEIGTLRAVGADLKVLSSSYIRQLLVIFGWGYGMGFGLYIIGYLLYIAIRKSMEWNKDVFELKMLETLALCSILFVICAVNLVIKIRKEMKHSIVENIREL